MTTPRGNYRSMSRRWLALGVAVLVLAAGGATAAAVLPGGPERDLGAYFFGPGMARAEVVMVVNGVIHDFRIDQGRVRGVRPNGIELIERDGTVEVVPIAPDARVQVNGLPAPLRAIRRGMLAVVVREGDGPATMIRARTGLR